MHILINVCVCVGGMRLDYYFNRSFTIFLVYIDKFIAAPTFTTQILAEL